MKKAKPKKTKKLSKKAFTKIDDTYFARTGRRKPGRKSAATTHDRTGAPLAR